MQNITASLTIEQVNDLVSDFISNYSKIIRNAAVQAGLDECFHADLINQIALKYARGKIQYDPARNTKPTTYIYKIARYAAIDMKRKNSPGFGVIMISMDDDSQKRQLEIENRTDDSVSSIDIEDTNVLICQAVHILKKKYHVSEDKLRIFFKWNNSRISVRELAENYGMNANSLSVQLSRIRKLWNSVFGQLRKEENEGTLKFSTDRSDSNLALAWVA